MAPLAPPGYAYACLHPSAILPQGGWAHFGDA